MIFRKRTSAPLVLLWLLLCALVASGRLQSGSVLAQQEAEEPEPVPLRVQPAALSASVEFGDSRQVSFTLFNDGNEPVIPRLYAARTEPPPEIVPRRRMPPRLQRVSLPDQGERIDAQIARDIDAAPDKQAEFLVFLKEQPDLAPAYAIADWRARGQFVYDTLHQNAERSQHDLRDWLDARGLSYRPLWIVNAIAVEGGLADVQALAGRGDVALLRANHTASLTRGAPAAWQPGSGVGLRAAPVQQLDEETIVWNLRQVRADHVWNDFGVTGEGITVANIDSGVMFKHPALVRQYRGYLDEDTFDHAYNWYDPANISDEPSDDIGHGTHVMGTMVARSDGTIDQPAVGMAPGATWIAARGCRGNTCNEADLIAAAQWLLTPTDPNGQNPRPDLRPHIINNSWAGESDDDFYIAYVTAWRAAGIFPVFVSGNNGATRCGTVSSPGDYDNVIAIGSTNTQDLISTFSGLGPSSNGLLKPDLTAPGQNILSTYTSFPYSLLRGTSMAAPHVSGAVALLWSANPALIGDYDATYELLTDTAKPITDERFDQPGFTGCEAVQVPNNVYGYGRLDAYAAIAEAQVAVPWLNLPTSLPTIGPGVGSTVKIGIDTQYIGGPGTYTARVLVADDSLSQEPLTVDMTLEVLDTPNKAHIMGTIRDDADGLPLIGVVEIDKTLYIPVDDTGSFTVTLPARAAPYEVVADVPGYVEQHTFFALTPGITREVEFELAADLPHLSLYPGAPLPGIPITTTLGIITGTLPYGGSSGHSVGVHNSGTQVLNYTASVPAEWFGVWRSDEPDGPDASWITLPENATTLSLGDDTSSEMLPLGFSFPFYGKMYEQVTVSANGFLSFQALPEHEFFSTSCLPIPETARTAIVPLRADLNPSGGGRVRAAEMAQGFVVSFEDVPLFSDLPLTPPSFSFQVLLARDGRIVFNYGQLGELPANVAVGMQDSTQSAHVIGCGQDAPVSSNLSLELRPQPPAPSWIEVAGETTGSLEPDAQQTITVTLKGIAAGNMSQPYRSAVVFESNDPWQPLVRLPVEIDVEDAPQRIFVPLMRKAGQ